jgi:hypothetical protein
MMHSNPSVASALINDCLKKCGFIRCFKTIFALIDAEINNEYTKVDLDDTNANRPFIFPEEPDKLVAINLYSNGLINNQLQRRLRDKEAIWIERFATGGKFSINARRTPKRQYDLDFLLSIPKSPTNKSTKEIVFPVILHVRGISPPDFDLDYDDSQVDEESVEKALLLYSLN